MQKGSTESPLEVYDRKVSDDSTVVCAQCVSYVGQNQGFAGGGGAGRWSQEEESEVCMDAIGTDREHEI